MTKTYRTYDTYKNYSYTPHIEAIDCLTCKKAVIAEFNPCDNGIIVYDFGPYVYKSKVRHRHPADAKTRARVMERVATNKRLLEDSDPGDYHYQPRRREGNVR